MYHICFVYIYPLNGYREVNSFEEPCFTLVANITSLARELNPTGEGKHIYCHPQTDCSVLSQLFSVARQARFPKLGSKYIVYIYIYIYICVCVCVCVHVRSLVCVCFCVIHRCLLLPAFICLSYQECPYEDQSPELCICVAFQVDKWICLLFWRIPIFRQLVVLLFFW